MAAIEAAAGMYALWGLAADHRGELRFRGATATKLGAMAVHASQKQHPNLLFWGNTSMYTPLILAGEIYHSVPQSYAPVAKPDVVA
jgi:hypothetical protein